MTYPAVPLPWTDVVSNDPRDIFADGLRRVRREYEEYKRRAQGEHREKRQDPRHRIAFVRIPAPLTDPLLLLDLAEHEPAVSWASPGEWEASALGELVRITASGEDRFNEVRDRARALFGRVTTVGGGAPPRLFGGFAFAPRAADEAPWQAFGDASFSLPRWTYERDAQGATLAFACFPEGLGGAEEAAARDELDRILRALSRTASDVPMPRAREVRHQDADSFGAQVEEIVSAIEAGHFEKVVAARRSEVTLGGRIDPSAVLRRLKKRFSGCTTFVFRREGAAFIGATPERLLTLEGRMVHTEALAGTASAADPDAAQKLAASTKDLEEHALVVREVERRLETFAAEVECPVSPSIRRLPNVLHLCTPISAELDRDLHVLDVAALLHPTPAVGGVPRSEAIEWIVAHENTPRGWYSGPVGWIDGEGGGELSVALRSGLLVGDRAYLWAGGGIVRDSLPGAEYDEASVKLSALLDALTGPAA
ncbi:MAG: isochorismate synthase [Deltaproteobacteria bacterium]|nr:MAG: isochorismate synthase [Deltaproteobacteria bacterium]